MSTAKPSFYSIALTVLCAGLSGGCYGGCDSVLPEPDICDQPSAGAIDSLELGEGTPTGMFLPWQDGDAVPLVFGSQGGAMLPWRMRVRGTQDTCLAQQLTITDAAGSLLSSFDYPIKLYPQEDGSMASETNYAVFDITPEAESLVTVSETVADQTATYSIQVLW